MSRLISKDFSRLEEFLAQYSIAEILNSRTREGLVKRGHKYCLASLQIWAMMEQFAKSGHLEIQGKPLAAEGTHLDQVAESFSDLTSAYFAVLHGLYKPAHMSLRSAIETFVRGLAGNECPEAASTTSVFRLFELASSCDAFGGASAQHFSSLRNEYASLCRVTHSSEPAHLVKNYAMSNFPKQDIEHLRSWTKSCEKIVKAMLSVLVQGNKDLYLQSAPAAQDVYEETIPKDVRLFALGAPTH